MQNNRERRPLVKADLTGGRQSGIHGQDDLQEL